MKLFAVAVSCRLTDEDRVKLGLSGDELPLGKFSVGYAYSETQEDAVSQVVKWFAKNGWTWDEGNIATVVVEIPFLVDGEEWKKPGAA